MILGPWHVHVAAPELEFHVPPLPLPSGAVVRITGDNGAGKTVFLEQVLVPCLEAQGYRVFHVPQDLSLHVHVMAASLALSGESPPRGLDALVQAWCAAAQPDHVLIFDETDRHLDEAAMTRLLNMKTAATFVVSHGQGIPMATHHLAVVRNGNCVHIQEQA